MYLHLHSQFQAKSLSGGIGRRARLKLVFFGVWVRFPPQVQKRAYNQTDFKLFLFLSILFKNINAPKKQVFYSKNIAAL